MTSPYSSFPQPPLPPQQPVQSGEVPDWAPRYGASMGQAIHRFFSKYATFSGRASPSEFWWWVLTDVIVVLGLYCLLIVVAIVGTATGGVGTGGGAAITGLFAAGVGFLIIAWELAILIPSLALTWRRLHDANLSGGFWFLTFVPFGGIVVFILVLLQPNPLGARFDRPPYAQYPPQQYPPQQFLPQQYPPQQYPPQQYPPQQ